ncbi:MAG: DNA repair exonuclease [Thermodesulfobacteriota bacterium]
MIFLHTADWQLGMKAGRLGEASSRVREERLSAAKRVVETAKKQGVDFVLVAGDTFEDNAVDRVLVQKVADILGAFGGPVYVIPGNHDPLVPGSIWEHPAWKSTLNVQILLEETPLEIPGGVLYPCIVREKHSGRNPVAWIPLERTNVIRVGIAHGTVEGVPQDEPDYPISRDAAQRAGLDYLALGHWHSYATYAGSDGPVRMAYSGTHETTKFGERESGNVLIVEIAAPGESPSVKPIRTGGLDWVTVEKEVHELGELAEVRRQLESLENPSNALVEVVLSGILKAEERVELGHIEQILSSRFLWGKSTVSDLRPSPEDEGWISDLPPGIIRDAAIRLRSDSDISPEVAARALIELYAITQEVSR